MTWIEKLFDSESRPAATAPEESPIRAVASKAAYVRRARKRMASIRSRMCDVRSEIINGVAVGRLKDDDRLDHLQQTASSCQCEVEANVDALRKSGFDQWNSLTSAVDTSIDAYRRAVNELGSLTETADH